MDIVNPDIDHYLKNTSGSVGMMGSRPYDGETGKNDVGVSNGSSGWIRSKVAYRNMVRRQTIVFQLLQ